MFALTGLLLFGAVGASAAPAMERGQIALGSEGELYSVYSGTYGELFPQSSGADAEASVLALEIATPGEESRRLLVPGTDDAFGDLEGSSSLVFEDRSGTVFLVWESRRNVIHRMLNLISFDGESWSEPLVIMSNFFALKGSPRLAITHDNYTVDVDGEPQSLHRAVLHLVWWEEGSEETEVLYSPIVLDNGSYPTTEPLIFRLNDFHMVDEGGPRAAVTEDFARMPTLHSGLEHRSVVIGFTDASSGRFLSLEITVLPAELGLLADGVEQTILDSGFKFNSGDLEAFAGTIRGNIIDIGRNLNQQNVSFLGGGIRGNIIDIGREWTGGLETFAGTIRGNIIDIGSNLFGGEVTRLYNADDFHITEVPTPNAAPPQAQSHILSMRVVTDRSLPALADPASAIFVSESGQNVLIAWEGEDELLYVESAGDEWTSVRSLPLGDHMDAGDGYRILESRTSTR